MRERTIRIGVMRGREQVREALDALVSGDARVAGQPANDLAPAQVIRRHPQWCFAADQLVEASDQNTGHCISLIAGQSRIVGHDTFMLLEPLVPAAGAVGAALERRMLMGLLMRLVAHEEVPAALVARTSSPALCHAMSEFARRYDAVPFFPRPDTNVLPMATAGLARQIARAIGMRVHDGRDIDPAGLASPAFVMLDLRDADDATLIERARKIYRARLPRGPAVASPQDQRRRTAGMMTAGD